MASDYETFWLMDRYAVVGHSKAKPFPKLTYGALKQNGKTVFAVDPSAEVIEGDRAYPDFESLPQAVEAAVLEVPKTEALEWCRRAANRGIKDIWLHQHCDSPEAVEFAKEQGIRLRTGTCAVMYLHQGFSPHAIHRFVNRLLGKY